jgi:hypothetical protein
MAHLPRWATQPRPTPVPWRRHKMRRWVRPDDLASAPALFAAIPSLPRAELARLTTRMIDRMDEIDGDPDLEHLHEDDEDTYDREQEQAHD